MTFQNQIILFFLFLVIPQQIRAHGLMTYPPQRGTLNPANKFNDHPINNSAPIDYKPHFPAGDKDSDPGAAVRSQIRAVPFWNPFTPLDSYFKWRAGVCGDEFGKPQDHMRGGKFYGGGQRVETYSQGGIIEIEVNILAHHNGFMEIHVCDIAKCGGEVSETCFKEGHCYHLKRAPDASCDSGFDKKCGPIDPVYPHRWYLPCTTVAENVQQRMGGPKMKFQLPEGLACDHCVVHWFWSAANTCNPPGVISYFEGANGPKNWGECFGQGGARGGYTKVQKDCGPDRFPEEYYQCADVKIVPTGRPLSWNPAVPTPTPASPSSSPLAVTTPKLTSKVVPKNPSGVLEDLTLVADGETIRTLPSGVVVDISPYKQISLEVLTTEPVGKMLFYVDGENIWTEFQGPYFLFGNTQREPKYWPNPVVNRFFDLRIEAGGFTMERRIMLLKR